MIGLLRKGIAVALELGSGFLQRKTNMHALQKQHIVNLFVDLTFLLSILGCMQALTKTTVSPASALLLPAATITKAWSSL